MSSYVNMDSGSGRKQATLPDDPNLSQEERDHRLAIAMQQQENAAAYEAQRKQKEASNIAKRNRIGRSGAAGGLAYIRGKDKGKLSVPKEYTTEGADVNPMSYHAPPAEKSSIPNDPDSAVAANFDQMEKAAAGTAQTMQKLMKEAETEAESSKLRTGFSVCKPFNN
eukprot:CAMPEP_0185724636 /NCGR_PEP_ID=MMETSP1171-20130828/1051_1 /TAXON_ID=374046 /ORGANISM="Helicotheca tamensis, Strain CCMP826" /LENGTH=166 /DNA_ID=CAMNT_0028392521 /DNA_START=16 /DNA_END=516 /DNA_ORIENTATION=-